VIKAYLDSVGVPSQIVLERTVGRAKPTVYSNVLKQMNAKSSQDLYRLSIPQMKNTMQIGVDVVNMGRKSIIGMTSTFTDFMT